MLEIVQVKLCQIAYSKTDGAEKISPSIAKPQTGGITSAATDNTKQKEALWH